MYLVSSCLAGISCRYDGKDFENEFVMKLLKEGEAVPVCPEMLAGLPAPRLCCEIITQENGDKIVINTEGQDITKEFMKGAEKTLEIAKIIGIEKAILKSRSPSCGCGLIYDGTFSGILIPGNGFTAKLLLDNGIKVITKNDIDLDQY